MFISGVQMFLVIIGYEEPDAGPPMVDILY